MALGSIDPGPGRCRSCRSYSGQPAVGRRIRIMAERSLTCRPTDPWGGRVIQLFLSHGHRQSLTTGYKKELSVNYQNFFILQLLFLVCICLPT